MNLLGVIFGALLLGSTVIPATTSAQAPGAPDRTATPLTPIERALLAQGTASYLHGAFAAAVGLSANGAISVFQREADMPDGGKLIAVTLVESRGQKHIVMASWSETDVYAFLTSSSGILKKALRATKDEGVWTPLSAREAETRFAAEKKFWLTASDLAPSPTSR